jgi:hypothetical protein
MTYDEILDKYANYQLTVFIPANTNCVSSIANQEEAIKKLVGIIQTNWYDDGGMAGFFKVEGCVSGNWRVIVTRSISDDDEYAREMDSENPENGYLRQFEAELTDCFFPFPWILENKVKFIERG